MKHKVSELEGALLARAVAMASGYEVVLEEGKEWIVRLPRQATPRGVPVASFGDYGWRPDQDFAIGGPIIERETISVGANFAHGERDAWRRKANGDHWWASIEIPVRGYTHAGGPTPLIAAMRAYVASKLGDEVELP